MTTVFTIGHSNHPRERFIALLRGEEITALADVRSTPFSRRHPQFSKPALAETLPQEGIAYVYLGEELGGHAEGPGVAARRGAGLRQDRRDAVVPAWAGSGDRWGEPAQDRAHVRRTGAPGLSPFPACEPTSGPAGSPKSIISWGMARSRSMTIPCAACWRRPIWMPENCSPKERRPTRWSRGLLRRADAGSSAASRGRPSGPAPNATDGLALAAQRRPMLPAR